MCVDFTPALERTVGRKYVINYGGEGPCQYGGDAGGTSK